MSGAFSTDMSAPMRRAVALVLIVGMGVSVLLAAGVSMYASDQPDGLERVASDTGIVETEQDSATADSPFADYGVSGLQDQQWTVGLAGVVGVLVTCGIAFLLFRALARGSSEPDQADGNPDG